jgi:hypothetical protein
MNEVTDFLMSPGQLEQLIIKMEFKGWGWEQTKNHLDQIIDWARQKERHHYCDGVAFLDTMREAGAIPEGTYLEILKAVVEFDRPYVIIQATSTDEKSE